MKPTREQIRIINKSLKRPVPLDYDTWKPEDWREVEGTVEFAVMAIKRLAEAFKD